MQGETVGGATSVRTATETDPSEPAPALEPGPSLGASEGDHASLRLRLHESHRPAADATGGEPKRGTITVVASPKGGVGKSVVASNLATGLAEFCGRRTVLVDANLYFGDQHVLLNLRPQKGMAQLAHLPEVDAAIALDLLTPHYSGLSVVVSPPDPVSAEHIAPDLVAELVRIYATMFDEVIVDTDAGLGELNFLLLEAADRVLLVTTPEMNTASKTGRFLHIAQLVGCQHKIEIVLNRATAGLRTEAVSDYLETPVAWTIASAGTAVVNAANAGETLFASDPARRERATRDLLGLVAAVAGAPTPSQTEQREPEPPTVTAEPVRPRRSFPLTGHVARGVAAAAAAIVLAWAAFFGPGTPPGPAAIAISDLPALPEVLPRQEVVAAPTRDDPATAIPSPGIVVSEAVAPSTPTVQAASSEPVAIPAAISEPVTLASTAATDEVSVVEEAPEPTVTDQAVPVAEQGVPDETVADVGVQETAPLTGTLFAPGLQAVSFHRSPSLSAPLLKMLPVGTEVEVLPDTAWANNQAWQQVQIQSGEIGWVIAYTVHVE